MLAIFIYKCTYQLYTGHLLEGKETGQYTAILLHLSLLLSLWAVLILLFLHSEHHRPSSAVVIGRVLREHHDNLIVFMDGCLIQVTDCLFSAGIVTQHIQRCVLIGFFSNASIVAMECQLCVTLDHNPESKLEEVLNVFDKMKPLGPNVASKIRRVSTLCYVPVYVITFLFA